MKVLYVTNMYPVEDYIYFGIHVKEQIDSLSIDGLYVEVCFINGRDRKWNYFKSISDIHKRLKENKFDLIHVHYGLSALFLLFYQPLIPVVLTLHSGELYRKKGLFNHLAQRSITMAILKYTNKIIVLNDDMLTLLDQYRQKLVKLPCGTDLNFFKEGKKSRPQNELILGFPGNKVRKEKNYKLFQEIIAELSKTLKIRVVEFHNFTRIEVLHNLQNVDVLVMTSLVEGSPQIIKEAMACNKPVVSTNVGDIADLLRDVKNCHVINGFKPEPFFKPIQEILSLPMKHRKSNGRQKLKQMELGLDQVAKSVLKVYKEIL
jgi:teichuronic acid biosynthesis glycosyltransferase TuaC